VEDFDDWTSWLLYKGGVGVKGENSWESWWLEEQVTFMFHLIVCVIFWSRYIIALFSVNPPVPWGRGPSDLEFGREVSKSWPRIVPHRNQIKLSRTICPLVELINYLSPNHLVFINNIQPKNPITSTTWTSLDFDF